MSVLVFPSALGAFRWLKPTTCGSAGAKLGETESPEFRVK